MTTALPGVVSYGKVTGYFIRAVMDTVADVDLNPEAIPVTGRVFIRAILPTGFAKIPTAQTIMIPDSITCTLVNGRIINTDGTPGITLVSTDDVDVQPKDFSYEVSFDFTNVVSPSAFRFQLPGGQTIDLSTVVPTGVSLVTSLSIAEAAAAAAATSAAQAAASLAAGGGGGGGGLSIEEIQDMLGGGFITAGTGIQVTYNDAGNQLQIINTGGVSAIQVAPDPTNSHIVVITY